MFVLSFYAATYVHTVYELGGIYPALRVPFYAVYAIAPVGLFLAGIQYGLATLKNLTSKGIYVSFDRLDVYEEPVVQEI
jgi:TRAP-type C4-dicarboxylate transport system permease small subunit